MYIYFLYGGWRLTNSFKRRCYMLLYSFWQK